MAIGKVMHVGCLLVFKLWGYNTSQHAYYITPPVSCLILNAWAVCDGPRDSQTALAFCEVQPGSNLYVVVSDNGNRAIHWLIVGH